MTTTVFLYQILRIIRDFLRFDFSFMFLRFSLKDLDLKDISSTQGIVCRHF